ncbi:hypothetical protein [Bacillus cereus group sp. BfR-BA-01380]|uniref:hypothetical protein n=1 Tax=Bacillus cereus group sp. BfR-BA-01380 TaxID=2920324 RepID=UPI001F58495D|nr:hypothetical protein [Bacillus cereus group sp. BfR-BA-01380]
MRSNQHYHTCRRYHGRVVRIENYDGKIHIGKIVDISDKSVWIEPVHKKRFDYGFGYSDCGCDVCGGLGECDNCGFGFGRGGFGAVELGFGFIFGITLAALFFI